MKQNLIAISLLGTFVVQSAMADLSFEKADNWNGKWQDGNGGLMVIQDHEGLLDVWGKDGASAYRLVCVLDRTSADKAVCVGDGMNHELEPKRFIYQSRVEINGKGEIDEDWSADFFQKGNRGKAVFKRLMGTGTR